MSKNPLVKKQIVDKNGVYTSRNVRDGVKTGAALERLAKVTPQPPTSSAALGSRPQSGRDRKTNEAEDAWLVADHEKAHAALERRRRDYGFKEQPRKR